MASLPYRSHDSGSALVTAIRGRGPVSLTIQLDSGPGNPRILKCLKKMAVPSIFEWTISPKTLEVARKRRLLKRQERTETVQPHQEDNITVVKSVLGEEGSTVEDPGISEMVVCNLDIGAEEIVGEFCEDPGPEVIAIGCTEEETNVLEESVKHYLSFKRIKDNDKLVNHYTGLDSTATFFTVFWSLGRGVDKLNYIYTQSCECLCTHDQFLLMLVRLRHHYPVIELARMFDISSFTVQNIFITWINFCAIQWGDINMWPKRSLVKKFCPSDFKRKFPTTRVNLDGKEIPIQIPSNPRSQRATFSTYKHRNTVKVLVGCTPGGLVSYISDAYGGSASDRQLVERSRIIDLCNSGDSIMADKGFNVQDLFARKDVTLNIPRFFKKKNRLHPLTVIRDRFISSKRVQVERIIGMLSNVRQNVLKW
ncbi:uncharacterized protein LOC131935215 [Physella acuta]|uniref:uncharacterized protein LOC131935215 n=1 Tax=Physella acuta TaxID=109671 RepID=UPI0027DC3659|nr:uncharacterized protein LOC131935215 [Physella acuta]